jgi:hypothetical protein
MSKSNNVNLRDYGDYITSALQTEGRLSLGGRRRLNPLVWTRHPPQRLRLRAYQTCCIAAGLPVIDSRVVAFEDVVRLAVRGPMVAVGEEASPPPYHALSFAPLGVVAQAYRAAGAEVFNLRDPAKPAPEE